MSDNPVKTCPKCGENALERLISRSSFALKGGGWYADGYGADTTPSTNSSDSSSNDGSDKKTTESSSEDATAPDTKTDDSTDSNSGTD